MENKPAGGEDQVIEERGFAFLERGNANLRVNLFLIERPDPKDMAVTTSHTFRQNGDTEPGGNERERGFHFAGLLHHGRAESGAAADAGPALIKGWRPAASIGDERLMLQMPDGQLFFASEGVVFGENDGKRLTMNKADGETFFLKRHAHKAGVHEAGAHGFHLLHGGHVFQIERDAGVFFAEGENNGGNDLRRCGSHKADAEVPCVAGSDFGNALLGLGDLLE